MNVLWITNTIFPDACAEIGIPPSVGGGWMSSSAKALYARELPLHLAVATFYDGIVFKYFLKNGVLYFLLPKKHTKEELKSYWLKAKKQFTPDIVHIHGTEYAYGLGYIDACGNDKVVVSIQGLVSVDERYYYLGISTRSIIRNITLRDIVRNDTVFKQKRSMRKRGRFEKTLLQSVDSIIGRTSWDKAHTRAINPNAQYYFCNETLRDVFYKNQWELDRCERYSIFLSQAQYPIKGFQQLVRALPLVIKEHPDTKVYIAGSDFFTGRGLRLHGYAKFIRALLKKHGLEETCHFTGLLSEESMCEQYLKSHVFVCPSSIENSPNSLGEAQILGVPCIASYVGGIPDMVEHGETGLLYRYEEVEMLAQGICDIFSDNTLASELSKNARDVAMRRHDRNRNTETLLTIYNELLLD